MIISEDFISSKFHLPRDGDVKFDKPSYQVMEAEFGPPETSRGYFVLKKAKDPDRKLLMHWFVENVLLLMKTNYMSAKNYSYIYAVKHGQKVAWASLA